MPKRPAKGKGKKAAAKELLDVEKRTDKDQEGQEEVVLSDEDNWERPPDESAKKGKGSKKPKPKEKANDKTKKGSKKDDMPQEKPQDEDIDITGDAKLPANNRTALQSANAGLSKLEVLRPILELIKSRLVEKFDGGNGVSWLDATLGQFELLDFTDGQKRLFLEQCLSHEVKGRFNDFKNGRSSESLTWVEIRSFFATNYHANVSDIGLDNALESFTFLPNDTPTSFIHRFHSLYTNKPHSDDEKKRDFRRVLPKPMRQPAMTVWSTFKSLQEAQNWVADQLPLYVNSAKLNVIDTDMDDLESIPKSALSRVINAITSEVTNNLRSQAKPYHKGHQQRFNGKCYNCNKRAGHKASDCPEPRRGKPKRDRERYDNSKKEKPAKRDSNESEN